MAAGTGCRGDGILLPGIELYQSTFRVMYITVAITTNAVYRAEQQLMRPLDAAAAIRNPVLEADTLRK